MGNRYARIVNDFFHDLAAGFFPGAATAAWVVHANARPTGGNPLTPQAVGAIWMILVVGLIVSAGTGVLRLRYHSDHVKPELVKSRNDSAFTKHVAFVIVLVAAGIVFGVLVAA